MGGIIGILVVAGVVLLVIRSSQRHKARRASLHQDGAGTWVWVDFDGSTRRSDIHPDQPGGAWHSKPSDNDGGGGGDSGDSGGDGGGD
ncbi:hypothetical protein [Maliponia aquimaris]|uniref:Uncharacterized protein n=1 Tax=Maliponia aquimaris TaxID=1673631 RepID=A0A238K5W3_9RHOB|nr:hypothetical protein [Maliponia aquimaris]SMX37857.1 hypothetical protein MAA8898_01285 [Maliponia aquimaris]